MLDGSNDAQRRLTIQGDKAYFLATRSVAAQRPSFLMTKPSIPLGLVFSQSGPYAMMAGEMRKSALMAVDEINQSDEFDFTFTPHLRDPGGVVAAYHTACARSHSRRACRSYRRLLHVGLAQAGHSHRRTDRAAALASGAIRRVRKQRQRHLCRGRAQSARRAAGAAYAGPHLRPTCSASGRTMSGPGKSTGSSAKS